MRELVELLGLLPGAALEELSGVSIRSSASTKVINLGLLYLGRLTLPARRWALFLKVPAILDPVMIAPSDSGVCP